MMGIRRAKASLADESGHRFFHLAQVVLFNTVLYKREIVYVHGRYICYVNLMRIKSDSVNL